MICKNVQIGRPRISPAENPITTLLTARGASTGSTSSPATVNAIEIYAG